MSRPVAIKLSLFPSESSFSWFCKVAAWKKKNKTKKNKITKHVLKYPKKHNAFLTLSNIFYKILRQNNVRAHDTLPPNEICNFWIPTHNAMTSVCTDARSSFICKCKKVFLVCNADNGQLTKPTYSAQWDLTYFLRTVNQFGPRTTLMQFQEDLSSHPGPNMDTRGEFFI